MGLLTLQGNSLLELSRPDRGAGSARSFTVASGSWIVLEALIDLHSSTLEFGMRPREMFWSGETAFISELPDAFACSCFDALHDAISSSFHCFCLQSSKNVIIWDNS